MQRLNFRSTPLVLALLTAGALGGAGVEVLHRQGIAHAQGTPAAGVVAGRPAPSVTNPDFARITELQGPAVVNISVTGVRKAAAGPAELEDMPEFFGRFGPGTPGLPEAPVRGAGSGFIVDANGIILTNAHVVDGATEVTVKLTDRREYQARVLGSDKKTDVAVLKIEAKDLPVVKLGSTRDLRVGEWVLAIGSPFGLENTVTAGVVSAKGRSLPDGSGVGFIQSDVAVNPGNSGGPLFNASGEVVGINSQIYSRSGGYQGLSFAIPIDLATRIKDQIVAHGKVDHARLGVTVQEVNQALADSFRLETPRGALVAQVEASGPADRAGLKSGDVVLGVDGEPVVGSGDLPALLSQHAAGDSVLLEVWRDGKRVQLTARLEGSQRGEAKAETAPAARTGGKLGLALRPPQPGDDSGLVVTAASGPAARAGVRAGDVIVSVNGVPAASIEAVRGAVDKAGSSIALLISRDGQRLFVPVRVG